MTKAEPNAALHLCANDVRINWHAAVDGAPHFVNPRLAAAPRRYFGNLRDEAAETLDHGNPARMAVRRAWA